MHEDRVITGHINPIWNDDFKKFNYIKQDVTDEEKEKWRNLGYDYVKNFTGWMYDSRNPMPKWLRTFRRTFGLIKQTYTFYKMKTLEIMPPHVDHFNTYIKINNVKYKDVYRIVVMLEDWKPGHYFELNGEGYVNWKAGDWFMWNSDVPHAASNIGVEDRYTLQITGAKLPMGTINEVFFGNFLDISDSDYDLYFRESIVYELDNIGPFVIHMTNGEIKELKDITHTKENVDYLNKTGITFYLYEPLCEYLEGEKFNRGFYSEFDENVDINKFRAWELDSILDYANRNNLTNITVKTGNFNVKKYFPYYNKLKLTTDDLFLRTLNTYKYTGNIRNFKFDKKFINLNWRYTDHRNLISSFMADKSCFLSWYFSKDFDEFYKIKGFNFDSWSKKYPKYFNILKEGNLLVKEKGPFVLDHTFRKYDNDDLWPVVDTLKKYETPATYNKDNKTLSDFYNRSFLDVVTETRFFQPTSNISEKILQPIQYLRPFIVVAPPYTLKYLKTFGFKTFDKFFDESYDEETDHGERLIKIFNTIEFINQLDSRQTLNMFLKMIPILQHNLNLYKKIFN